MARIEVTAAIRRSPDEVFQYLADFRNHAAFLPADRFRSYAFDTGSDKPARQMQVEVHLLGRWWPLNLSITQEQPGKELIQQSGPPVTLRTAWSLTPLRADRRGPRTAVKLSVDYALPGGPIGRIMDTLLLKNEAFKIYDQVIRQLPIALEGKPKSGLKAEEP